MIWTRTWLFQPKLKYSAGIRYGCCIIWDILDQHFQPCVNLTIGSCLHFDHFWKIKTLGISITETCGSKLNHICLNHNCLLIFHKSLTCSGYHEIKNNNFTKTILLLWNGCSLTEGMFQGSIMNMSMIHLLLGHWSISLWRFYLFILAAFFKAEKNRYLHFVVWVTIAPRLLFPGLCLALSILSH